MNAVLANLPTDPVRISAPRPSLGTWARTAVSVGSLMALLGLLGASEVALRRGNRAGEVLPAFDVGAIPYHDPKFTARHQRLVALGRSPEVLFTGDSWVMNGIDPDVVARELGRPPEDFLNFGTGSQTIEFARQALLPHLRESGVRPRLLLVGLSPGWYAPRTPTVLISSYESSLAYQMAHPDPGLAGLARAPHFALARRLALVRYAREWLAFELFPRLRGRGRSPYVFPSYLGPRGMTAQELARLEGQQSRLGWDRHPFTGRTAGVNLEGADVRRATDDHLRVETPALARLIYDARAQGIALVLVWMPAQSSFWQWFDPADRHRAEEEIHRTAEAEGVPVLRPTRDYDRAGLFVDGRHMSAAGAGEFSADLAALLRPLLAAPPGDTPRPIVAGSSSAAAPARPTAWVPPLTFDSAPYWLFFAAAWPLALAPRRPLARQLTLLLLSYAFYATWSVRFAGLLAMSSLANYLAGVLLRRRPSGRTLALAVAANVALLVSLKSQVVGGGVVPVGVSFYTFQAIGYLIDVYRGSAPEPSIVEFLLYMAFWPMLLAGPIGRAPEMIPQFRQSAGPTRADIGEGFRRIVCGLFMKVVVADTLARGVSAGGGVNDAFDHGRGGWGGVEVAILAVAFGLQLFFDFAGYSHVAIGCARLLGFRLRENFDHPYAAPTVTDFWARWHMSLSSWIRDYFFFPLASLKRSLGWRNLALVLSMAAFGLWHGLTLRFALWGIYQGLLLVGHRQVQGLRRARPDLRLPALLEWAASWAATVGLVSLGWIPFRANDVGQAAAMLGALVDPRRLLVNVLPANFHILVALVMGGYLLYLASRGAGRRLRTTAVGSDLVWAFRPALYAGALLLIVICSSQASTFVYLQF